MLKVLAQNPEWRQNSFLGSGQQLAEAMALAPSIDTFLETHRNNREFVLLGKLGIARVIAEAERKSKLAPRGDNAERPFELQSMADTWYPRLAQQMFTGVPADQPEKAFENVSFIVFNYDRCLQAYLLLALQRYFLISESHAAKIISSTTIIHPYGSLGSIIPANETVPFAPRDMDLEAAARQIRTYSESSEIVDSIRSRFFGAETIVFLGFAFHPANMELLDPRTQLGPDDYNYKRIYATTLGLSKSDEEVVRGQLEAMVLSQPASTKWIFTNNGTCTDLFTNFWRSLTA